MKQNELLHAISSLTESQRQSLEFWLKDKILLNERIESQKPNICPYCLKETRMIKKGLLNKKQRYECKECHHKFVYNSKTITSNIKIDKSIFYEIVMDTLEVVAINKTAARLDISPKTVFYNRHKFLAYIEEYLRTESNVLSGTIEIDEAYFLDSRKGCRNINRKARHRGEPSNFRGISHEQISLVTTTDRNGHEIFKAVSYGKPTSKIIVSIFKDKFNKGSIMYCDGTFIYDELSKVNGCILKQFKSYYEYNNVEHLNTVNYIHSLFKKLFRQYRGVSSKYLNRYLSLFNFIRRFTDMDTNEKLPLLLDDMKWYNIYITYKYIDNTTLSFN